MTGHSYPLTIQRLVQAAAGLARPLSSFPILLACRSFASTAVQPAEALDANRMTELAPAGTRYSVSVLTTHTVDSSPSLLVAFENQRYLFGTPEGFSRIALQNKVGLRKVGHVFLGDLAQSGGLPGFLLTSVEAGNDKIKVFGPRGTDHLLASCRFFTRRCAPFDSRIASYR